MQDYGQILLDHLLRYALIATVDVLVMYLQQFWKTVKQVETLNNPFITPVNIKVIKIFMHRVGYQGVVDKGKKRNQSVRGISSPRKSLKVTIRKNKQSTTPIPPPGDDKERDEMAEETFLSLTLYKTALAAEAQENIAKVQEKLEEEEIERWIEPESQKKNPKVVVDDNVTKKKDDDVEKTNDATEEKDNDDHTDHTLVGTHTTGSMETKNEQMQTPIPIPNQSPRKQLSSDKTISEELTATVSPTSATTSKSKSKREFTSNKTKILPESIAGMCR
nr:hypothetical protein [Tanacetum cinerariifolium]